MFYLSLVIVILGFLILFLSLISDFDKSKKKKDDKNLDCESVDLPDLQEYEQPIVDECDDKLNFDLSRNREKDKNIEEKIDDNIESFFEVDDVEECDEVEYFTWDQSSNNDFQKSDDSLGSNQFVDEMESDFDNDELENRESDNFESDDLVVLFEDFSSVIDYDTNNSTIDSTLKEYENIKRLGKGNFFVINEGVSFYIGKKLYRFDFRNLIDVKQGDNFLALFYGAGRAVKLFISIESFQGFEKAFSEYNKYKQEFM